jgi:hypothetical protein
MLIKGIEYKKIISICTKCGFISPTTYLEPKFHYVLGDNGKNNKFCGHFELFVESENQKEQMISSDFY